MRKVQPKAAPPASSGQTRKQRERFVQAGGMLQGYAPEQVIRIGYISIAIAVACLLIIGYALLELALLVLAVPILVAEVLLLASLIWRPPSRASRRPSELPARALA